MTPLDLAVGKDGTLYRRGLPQRPDPRDRRRRHDPHRGRRRAERRVAPEDGINGLQAALCSAAESVETGPDGERLLRRRRQASAVSAASTPDGTVTTVAGGKPVRRRQTTATAAPATAANLSTPRASRWGGDGSLYLTDFGRIRRVALGRHASRPSRAAAATRATNADRVPAGSVRFDAAMGIDIAPDGSLYSSPGSGLSRISRPFPTTATACWPIPSKDGGEVYFFDSNRPPPAHAGRPHRRHRSGASPMTTTAGWHA